MSLSATAQELAGWLGQHPCQLVLAESCTAGMIAATLGGIPGISSYFCGSSVVYREPTKQQWLGVDAETIRQWSAVSEPVTSAIARGVLERTKEATVSLGITGHLGPDAPSELDGTIFLALWAREAGKLRERRVQRLQLTASGRRARQQEASLRALQFLLDFLPGLHAS